MIFLHWKLSHSVEEREDPVCSVELFPGTGWRRGSTLASHPKEEERQSSFTLFTGEE